MLARPAADFIQQFLGPALDVLALQKLFIRAKLALRAGFAAQRVALTALRIAAGAGLSLAVLLLLLLVLRHRFA